MSKLVLFPPTKQAAAETYRAAADALYAATFEPGGTFSYIRPDISGNWAVPYYGPGWTFDGTAFAEPESMVPLRMDGVVHDFAVWVEDA